MARFIAGQKSGKKSSNVVSNAGQFYDELTDLYKYSVALAGVLAIWGSGGAKAMFPRSMAAKVRGVIHSTMDDPGGVGSADVNWEDNSDYYKRWKKEEGYGDKPWHLSGMTRAHIVKGRKISTGYVIGVDQRYRVPRISYGGTSGKMKLEEYAAYMEYGTKNMVARPLFIPSFEKVIQEDYPKLIGLVNRSIERATKIFAPKPKVRNVATPEDVISQASLTASGGFEQSHITDLLVRNKKIDGFQLDDNYIDKRAANKFKRQSESELAKLFADVKDPVERARLIKWTLSNKENMDDI